MQHYLLLFDHVEGRLLACEQFDDAETATVRYSELEDEHADNHRLEIVLIGADSFETVKRTHANYFPSGIASSKYLAGL